MQQSSSSIGSLAAALARAQVVLGRTSALRLDGCHHRLLRIDEVEIFRYAPLSDGLNIIRKTLGQT